MTKLQIRRVPFDFSGDVPFAWNPHNAEFSTMMNLVSFMAVAFEKYIVDTVRAAQPRISDPSVAEEAESFLRQEAQHSRAHRLHIKALVRQYPGLQSTLDEALAGFQELFESKPLQYHLAYIADLEATFTPWFKMLLDHENELFAPGDDRVASLFLWHFVEEVEHRSSALIIYGHLVESRWYRLGQLPSVARHLTSTSKRIFEGFSQHVPLEDRLVDYGGETIHEATVAAVRSGVAKLRGRSADPGDSFLSCVSTSERLSAFRGLLSSQQPWHDPAHQNLPVFADEWFAAFDRGEDVSRWYERTTIEPVALPR